MAEEKDLELEGMMAEAIALRKKISELEKENELLKAQIVQLELENNTQNRELGELLEEIEENLRGGLK